MSGPARIPAGGVLGTAGGLDVLGVGTEAGVPPGEADLDWGSRKQLLWKFGAGVEGWLSFLEMRGLGGGGPELGFPKQVVAGGSPEEVTGVKVF